MFQAMLAITLLALLSSSTLTVLGDIADPAPMTQDAMTAWMIISGIMTIAIWIVSHLLLDAWVGRLKRRPEIEHVRSEVKALLPAYLAAIGQQDPGSTLWLLYTPSGPILRTKPHGSSLPGPEVELDDETRAALKSILHAARRRAFGPISTRILGFGESLYQIPCPSNHQIMEALALARRAT